MLRSCILFFSALVCSCNDPGGKDKDIVAPKLISYEGVQEMPAFGLECEGNVYHPSYRINAAIELENEYATATTIRFQLRDARTLKTSIQIDRSISYADVKREKEGKTQILLDDIFSAPSSNLPNGKSLPEGIYYIEALVESKGRMEIVARSGIIAISPP
jgi:hypothetical protein